MRKQKDVNVVAMTALHNRGFQTMNARHNGLNHEDMRKRARDILSGSSKDYVLLLLSWSNHRGAPFDAT